MNSHKLSHVCTDVVLGFKTPAFSKLFSPPPVIFWNMISFHFLWNFFLDSSSGKSAIHQGRVVRKIRHFAGNPDSAAPRDCSSGKKYKKHIKTRGYCVTTGSGIQTEVSSKQSKKSFPAAFPTWRSHMAIPLHRKRRNQNWSRGDDEGLNAEFSKRNFFMPDCFY